MNTLKFNTRLFSAVYNAVPTKRNTGRPYLDYVFIERASNLEGVTITATDGRLLLSGHDPEGIVPEEGALIRTFRNKEPPKKIFESDDKNAYVVTEKLPNEGKFSTDIIAYHSLSDAYVFERAEYQYPDWKRMFRMYKFDGRVMPPLNPTELVKVSQTATTISAYPRFIPSSRLSDAVLLQFMSQQGEFSLSGLVMPMAKTRSTCWATLTLTIR